MSDFIHVLSIDDSKAVHAFLDVCLEGTKVKLTHVMNGKQGLEEAEKNPFDLILLDWEMPEITGPEVLSRIRQRDSTTPIIMLTSKNEVEDIASMIQNGANEYIMKPFTAQIIIDKIESVLGKSARTT